MTSTAPRPSRRRPAPINGLQVMFAAILSIGLILGINFSTRIADSQPLQEAYVRVQREIEELEAERVQLLQQRDYVRSDAYVESWARSDGKMVRPGDLLFVPVPGVVAAAPPPTPVPLLLEPETSARATWTLWWSLFFDSPPPDF